MDAAGTNSIILSQNQPTHESLPDCKEAEWQEATNIFILWTVIYVQADSYGYIDRQNWFFI
jgi:hypothetical protein